MRTLLLLCLATAAFAQIYPLEGANPAAVATDKQGNIYVVGNTSSTHFPVTANALQPTLKGTTNAFIAKLSPGGQLLWSTYFGGSGTDQANGVAVDSAGNVLVAGTTRSSDLPVLNAYQGTLAGASDVFLVKLDPTGKLLYSTYLGGSNTDAATGLAVDGAGAAYITGNTASGDFPGQTTIAGGMAGFVLKISATGSLVYSWESNESNSSPAAIAVDSAGSAYITGNIAFLSTFAPDLAFVIKLSPDGSHIAYESHFGGSETNYASAIAVDSTGAAYIAGATTSVDFPVVSPVQATLGARPLWISADGGNTWTLVDNLPFGLLQALVPDPKTPGTLYAAASDTGVFRSTDGGKTFTPLNNGVADPKIYSLAFNPSNPAAMYAGAQAGELYASTNGGATWSLLHSFAGTLAAVDVEVDPQQPATLYASGDALFKSTDGGSTWVSLPGPPFGLSQMLVDPSIEGTLYAYTNGGPVCCFGFVLPQLARSTDGGATWTTAYDGAGQPGLVADPSTNPATIYSGTEARSSDGGKTWTALSPTPGIASASAMAADPRTGTLYAAGIPGQPIPLSFDISTDRGQTWTQLSVPSQMPGITGITPTPGALYAWNQSPQNSAIVLKLSPDGSTILYSTYLRGHNGGGPGGPALALDGSGNMLVAGTTTSVDFPTVNGAQSAISGSVDAFLTLLSADGQEIAYSTYLGGPKTTEARAVAVDPAGNLIFAGLTDSLTILGTSIPQDPTSSSTEDSGFVAKFSVAAPVPSPAITKVLSAASFQAPIESGSWVMIQGSDLANSTRLWQTSDFNGNNLPTKLDGVSVTIDGIPAYVEYISPAQINVLAPPDSNTGSVNVVVTNNGSVSAPAKAQLQSVAPALFMTPSYNAIASVIPGYTPVTASAPAMPGDLVVLWGTGFGPTNPPTPAGTIVTGAPATATLPVVTVGGIDVPVISSVLTTGTVGLYQITIRLPNTIPWGTPAIQASIGGAQTQSGVTLFVGAQ